MQSRHNFTYDNSVPLILCFYLSFMLYSVVLFVHFAVGQNDRTWEEKHLNPSWSFENELGRKVRSLLDVMDHPINMAHLSKLFTSQLILSCNFNVSNRYQTIINNLINAIFYNFMPMVCFIVCPQQLGCGARITTRFAKY